MAPQPSRIGFLQLAPTSTELAKQAILALVLALASCGRHDSVDAPKSSVAGSTGSVGDGRLPFFGDGGVPPQRVVMEPGLILEFGVGKVTNRVFSDGRYESFTSFETTVGYDGKAVRHEVDPKWRLVYSFTKSELAELTQAIAEANIPGLKTSDSPPGQSFDGSTMIWRVLSNGVVKEITIEHYPATKVPALDTLFKRFNQIHKMPKSSAVWRVTTPAGVVERSIDCDGSSVAVLRPVFHALFASDDLDHVSGAAPASNAIVLDIQWVEDGLPTEQTRLYRDGRYVSIVKGVEKGEKTLSSAQLKRLDSALGVIAWPTVSLVCE